MCLVEFFGGFLHMMNKVYVYWKKKSDNLTEDEAFNDNLDRISKRLTSDALQKAEEELFSDLDFRKYTRSHVK